MFTIWMIVEFVFAIMEWYKRASNEAAIAEACADDKDAGSKVPNDDCMAAKRSSMQFAVTFLIAFFGFILYHLSMIAYTHWQNFGKTEQQVEDELRTEEEEDARQAEVAAKQPEPAEKEWPIDV